MSATKIQNKRIEILGRIMPFLGKDRILSDPVDLYVYSFHGSFATSRSKLPLLVVRCLKGEDEKDLSSSLDGEDIELMTNHEVGIKEPISDFILVDERKVCSSESLFYKILELKKSQAKDKDRLKKSTSFSEWFVNRLKTDDGYRLDEVIDVDNGFCIMQPYFDGIETYSSKGRMLLCRALIKGDLKPTKKLADSLYTCTACGQCYDQISLRDLEVNNAIIRARYKLVEEGSTNRQFKTVIDNISSNGNPMGMPSEDRSIWYEDLAEEFPYGLNKVLFWTGCTTSYRLPNIIEYISKIFLKADIEFGFLGEDEGCCGLILYLLGFWDQAGDNAYKITGNLIEKKVKTLVTNCSGCYYAFKKVFPFLGVELPLRVLHTSQLMDYLVKEAKLTLKGIEGRFMWHDPCDLGRHCGVYEPPRDVLKSIPGIELKEPELNREHAICCGGGGGLMIYNEKLSNKIGASKIEEASKLGLDGVITGCPACILNLNNASRNHPKSLPIYDLSEIIMKCLD